MRNLNAPRRLRARAPSGIEAALIIVLTVSTAAIAATGATAQDVTVYTGATVWTGADSARTAAARIVVEGERIRCVGIVDACPAPEVARHVDLSGAWVEPGMIDPHVHLYLDDDPERARMDQRLRFALGITTTRDAGTLALDAALAERAGSDLAGAAMPRLLVSARAHELYADRFGGSDPETLVDGLADAGVDGIKLKDEPTADRLVRLVRAARARGLPVSGHTWDGPPPLVMTEAAIDAGIDGVVHLGSFAPMVTDSATLVAFPDEDRRPGAFYRWRKQMWATAPLERLEPVLRRMVDADVWLEPSLTAEFHFGRRVPLPRDLEWVRREPLDLRGRIRALLDRSPSGAARFPDAYAGMEAFVRRFHQLGGTLVAGSDQQEPGVDYHVELELLGRAGLPPSAVAMAATRNAARAVGRADRGVLEPGRLADFVVYDADPWANPADRRRIRAVVKGGHVHDPADILAPYHAWWAEREGSWVVGWVPWAAALLILAGLAGWSVRRNGRRREG